MKASLLRLRVSLLAAVLLVILGACGGTARPTPPKAPAEAAAVPAPVDPASADEGAAVPVAAADAVRGQRGALVTVVVFSDFQCPFCGRLESTFERLRETYDGDTLRFVFKNAPLPFHEHARRAAEVGAGVLALGGQDAFWRYAASAFRGQAAMSADALRSWAIAAGVDGAALDRGLEERRWSSKVEADEAVARRLGVEGTPQSYVNGIEVGGAQPFDAFKVIIDGEIEKAKAAVARGVPRAKLYAELTNANYKTPAPAADDDEDARDAAEAKIVSKIPVGKAPVRGPATARVTIIEFSDFQCPFCKRGDETLARVRREYGDKVRVVWRDMPLAFHPRAKPAAELARAARAQKGDAAFWTVHDLLFQSQPKLEDEDLERVAREAHLDVAKAMAAVKAKKYAKDLDVDVDVAGDFEVTGTPAFFINGRRIVGAKPFEAFKTIIDEELAKADALVAAGTKEAALYEAIVKDGVTGKEPERKAITASKSAPFRGAANAKVVIEEVSDFQCPFCKRVGPTLDQLLQTYPGQIKIVWRDHPLPFHQHAALAAEAAREAQAQKGNAGFFKMHDRIFENQTTLERSDLESHARALGLDMDRFTKALDARSHKAGVDADDQAVTAAGVSGTPAFFIGPYYLSGAQPYAKFRRLVDRVLAESGGKAAGKEARAE